MNTPVLSDAEFVLLRDWVQTEAGIDLSAAKKPLVTSRLLKRLTQLGLGSFGDYYRLIVQGGSHETQTALDLLTTNETYFFREPKHFAFLRDHALPARRPGLAYRVWSAACSSGEEAWSIAMTLAEALPDAPWEILASDLSTRVLERARSALYALERADHIPTPLLKKYCLRGIGSQAGSFRLDRPLRQRVRFVQVNLVQPLPDLGMFDLVCLRNVLIYFDVATKADVVRRLCERLRPGGYFFCGHSESLHGLEVPLQAVQPAIYRRQ
ncbi:MAG: protein-glutamate O-methyltransferase CheR [Gammaproteobacteria bacterium]